MTADEQPANGDSAPAPALPDYVTSPNAVFADQGVQWRYGKPPDYSKTRKFWEEGRKSNHAAGSLEQIVENLVKNWEVEASFKPRLEDWRTIDHAAYTFAMNGGPGQSGEHMLKVGTYNAIIEPNEYYDPNYSDFASSHKTFKRMMPTFAWEVMEVYSGPPVVSFKWRHWGEMKNDYVGFNNKGEKVTAKSHGGPIDIYGVTIAKVDDKLRVQSLDTWMDPLAMFRQIAPHGVVNKEIMNHKVAKAEALDYAPSHDGIKIAEEHNADESKTGSAETDRNSTPPESTKHISNLSGQPADAPVQIAGGCPFMSGSLSASDATLPEGHLPVAGQASQVRDQSNGTTESGTVQESAEGGAPTDMTSMQSGVNGTKHGDISMEVDSGSTDPTQHAAATVAATSALSTKPAAQDDIPRSIYSSAVSGDVEDVIKLGRSAEREDESVTTGTYDAVDKHLESSADVVHPHPKTMEQQVQPDAGEAVAAPAGSDETRKTMDEMSEIKPGEDEMTLNRE